MLLLGERDAKIEQIAKIESAFATVAGMRERVEEIAHLVEACVTVIKSDHP